jgi:AraC family transcriptional regulator
MDANVCGELTLNDLVNECQWSVVSQFPRAFGQTTGSASHRYLQERRFDKAKGLSRDLNLSLVDVALARGCSDQSHFTQTFTQMVGVSLGLWRRNQAR